jgi:hypothetical protein
MNTVVLMPGWIILKNVNGVVQNSSQKKKGKIFVMMVVIELITDIQKMRIMKMDDAPEIVKRAYNREVTNIGQLSKQELKDLRKWTAKGYLERVWNGAFPIPKHCWIRNYENYPE